MTSDLSRYAAANARVRTLLASLLGRGGLETLYGYPTTEALLDALERTPYAPPASAAHISERGLLQRLAAVGRAVLGHPRRPGTGVSPPVPPATRDRQPEDDHSRRAAAPPVGRRRTVSRTASRHRHSGPRDAGSGARCPRAGRSPRRERVRSGPARGDPRRRRRRAVRARGRDRARLLRAPVGSQPHALRSTDCRVRPRVARHPVRHPQPELDRPLPRCARPLPRGDPELHAAPGTVDHDRHPPRPGRGAAAPPGRRRSAARRTERCSRTPRRADSTHRPLGSGDSSPCRFNAPWRAIPSTSASRWGFCSPRRSRSATCAFCSRRRASACHPQTPSIASRRCGTEGAPSRVEPRTHAPPHRWSSWPGSSKPSRGPSRVSVSCTCSTCGARSSRSRPIRPYDVGGQLAKLEALGRTLDAGLRDPRPRDARARGGR